MIDVTALGEFLIDFTPHGENEEGVRLLEENPGGAPVNVLTALSRLGKKTAFIGKVGDDLHGHFLARVLEDNGIDGRGLRFSKAAYTTLAFVALSPGGERTFSFARAPGADTTLTVEELPGELLRDSRILHVGSLSMTHEPARSATLAAVEVAKKAGALISYDPNYRAPLWPSEEEAVRRMRFLAPRADLVKLSDEETKLLTGEEDPRRAAEGLLEQGAALVAVTLGGKGALVANRNAVVSRPGHGVPMVDTTGAGDAFWGGLLARLLELGGAPEELSGEELLDLARWGNAAAALCIGKRGAIPAMPTGEEVRRLLEGEALGCE